MGSVEGQMENTRAGCGAGRGAGLFGTLGRRMASERGSVGVVVALVLFVVLGMLTMTWNTAQVSKAKMRLQNAADSAALAHAIWQARGMNTVQNINCEMYEGLGLAIQILTAGEALLQLGNVSIEIGAALMTIPVIGTAAGIVLIGLGMNFMGIGSYVLSAGSWLSMGICDIFLKTLALVYAKSAGLLGAWNAQQLAWQNEADPLTQIADGFGIYSIGLSSEFLDLYILPLEESNGAEANAMPWKFDSDSITDWLSFKLHIPEKFMFVTKLIKEALNSLGLPKGWTIKPLVSKRGDQEGLKTENGTVTDDSVLPTPTMWVAFKLGKHIETLPLDGFWNPDDSKKWQHKQTMYAVAAAQCITGDVVPHSERPGQGKANHRPMGFGTGATAKLVPVAEVFHRMDKAKGEIMESIIFH